MLVLTASCLAGILPLAGLDLLGTPRYAVFMLAAAGVLALPFVFARFCRFTATVAAIVVFGTVLSTSVAAQDAVLPEVLPRGCEIELALSAAPAHLRDASAVWVMDEAGYVLAREGTNGFACIVNRDDPRSLKPTCFDPEGAETMIARIELVGLMLLDGAPMAEIAARLEQAFASGELARPRRVGVAFMLSPQNRPWNPEAGRLARFPPHVMIYAPDVTNEDIGFDYETLGNSSGLPFVGYQGPHGFLILVDDDLETGMADLSSCPSWVTSGP